jgi:hypothetical protein
MSARPLYDSEPKDLPQEQLQALYAGLLSKLALTCEEMIGRSEEYAHLLRHWLQSDVASTLSATERMREKIGAESFRKSAERTRALYTTLKSELLCIHDDRMPS